MAQTFGGSFIKPDAASGGIFAQPLGPSTTPEQLAAIVGWFAAQKK